MPFQPTYEPKLHKPSLSYQHPISKDPASDWLVLYAFVWGLIVGLSFLFVFWR